MFGWLRDALTNVPSSFTSSHQPSSSTTLRTTTPCAPSSSSFLHQNHFTSDDDDDDGIDPSHNNSFYHNPYHSSGQMNYVDLPQQQFTNEHTYPTFLARQQTSQINHPSLDDQIHEKLISLQRRSHQYQSYQHRQNNYAFRNRTIPNELMTNFQENNQQHFQRSDDDDEDREEEDEEEEEDDDDEKETEEKEPEDNDNDDQRKSSTLDKNHRISNFYSGQYSNIDEQFDLASVVVWYKNVMQSVKKFL